MLYVCSFLYIGLSVLLLFRRGQNLYRHERRGVLAYNAALLTGNLMRMLLPRVLVMDTFCTIAITIIFFGFTNPHLFIDQRHIAFNKRGLRLLLAEALEAESFHVMGMVIRNYQQERVVVGGECMDQATESISAWVLQALPRNVLFYLGSGRFAMMGNHTDWNALHAKMRSRFANPWETETSTLHLGALFVNVDEGSGLNSPEKITNTLVLALESAERNIGMGTEKSADTMSIGEVYEQIATLRTLEGVLERNEVEVFLQPIVSSSSHALVGTEALARMRDERGNYIPPSLFIPIAEHAGLINELGSQVFNKVCEFIATHNLEELGLQWININLSPLQCVQRDIAERFESILGRYGVSPDVIHLEITEQSLIDHTLIKNQIFQLCEMGFRFALDDYGTGYSNLVRLSDFPFANVKLDMSLVRSYSRDKGNLLPAMVSGLKDIGYTITAEGVETEDMANALSAIGADFLQGYLFARPLPMDEFARTYGR
ncbi:MAG: EAL domain-containing protein [Atopobiaceae bacterium]|nr:EAL domain-containing protein [Atopobiaceae bacterium]